MSDGRYLARPLSSLLGFTAALCSSLTLVHAQNSAIDELRGTVFDARMAQQTFADGLKYCNELNGKSFYFRLRNRILNLEEYLRSLENLAKAQVYNPAKRRGWTLEDAKERREEGEETGGGRQAEVRAFCAKSSELEKQLKELQKNTVTSEEED